jgi:hypothetical protein
VGQRECIIEFWVRGCVKVGEAREEVRYLGDYMVAVKRE